MSHVPILQAALLHDTIEDTHTTPEEIEEQFGSEVQGLVEEVTDDKSLPKLERKRLQVAHAPQLSEGAKQIKIADKICNMRDVIHSPPTGWSMARRREYLVWTARVVDGCRGSNAGLEREYDDLASQGSQL